ncbi:MAG: glycosyltransferase [Bacteroidales bacterium]|nr:glycosyltransferase [Bacteroidales bacterium]
MNSMDSGFIETADSVEANIHLLELDINHLFWNINLPFNKIIKKGFYCMRINTVAQDFIEKYNIDAVLFYNMVLYPLSKQKNIVTIYDLGDDHIDLLSHELGKFSNRLMLGFAEKLLKRTLQNCDHVLSVSNYLAKKYFNKSYYLPNGVNLEDIHPGCGESLKTKYKRPVIGFVGSLEYFINFEQITSAAAILRDYTFVIAGGGREYDRIKNEKKRLGLENLILTGGLPHSEILRHIDSFDICLNLFKPSPLTDGACPIKLFEYMAFRKPIISSRIQEVQSIGDKFIYWADNTNEIVARIKEIFCNPSDASRRTDAGFNILQEMYTWPQIATKFETIVEESMEK